MTMISSVVKTIEKPIHLVADTKVMKTVCEKFQADDVKFIAGLGMTSIVLKDGLGCYMYVKQSLNNKNIPEEKRKFVAALDLANGGLMIIAQILMFKTISNEKFQAKIFDKLFGKYFTRAAKKGAQELMLSQKKFAGKITNKEFNINFAKCKKEIQGHFGVLTSLVAATIIAKRVIVPFIATPLAEKAKGLLGVKKEAKNPEVKANKG